MRHSKPVRLGNHPYRIHNPDFSNDENDQVIHNELEAVSRQFCAPNSKSSEL